MGRSVTARRLPCKPRSTTVQRLALLLCSWRSCFRACCEHLSDNATFCESEVGKELAPPCLPFIVQDQRSLLALDAGSNLHNSQCIHCSGPKEPASFGCWE